VANGKTRDLVAERLYNKDTTSARDISNKNRLLVARRGGATLALTERTSIY
jgi:hypothetical protein